MPTLPPRSSQVATLLLLLLFGWATLPLASLVSFLFRSPSNALIAMIGFYFLSGFGLIVADFIMSSVRARPHAATHARTQRTHARLQPYAREPAARAAAAAPLTHACSPTTPPPAQLPKT